MFLFAQATFFAQEERSVDSQALLAECKKIEAHPHFRMVRNILSTNSLGNVSRNWDNIRDINFTFSNEVDPQLPPTNQKMTGRCWMFAALNRLRFPLCKREGLNEFEFSQSYLFFFDKVEKSNFFLEQIIDQEQKGEHGEVFRFLISQPIFDGNYWSSFVSLVKKYGLVPKSVYPESEVCFTSGLLNRILSMKLLQGAEKIRTCFENGGNVRQARAIKKEIMTDVYKILVVHMGTPPSEFSWSYYSAEKKYHLHKKLTPQSFYEKFVKIKLDDYVILVHSPLEETPYYNKFTVQYTDLVLGSEGYTCLNVPIAEMKQIAKQLLVEKKVPVLFAADIFFSDVATGILDPKMFEFDALYEVDFSMTKGAKLRYDLSSANHQMLFTGIDIEDGVPKKWKVENSWGQEAGRRGFFIMTDPWFDEYVFELIVPKKLLTEEMKNGFEKPATKINPWSFCLARSSYKHGEKREEGDCSHPPSGAWVLSDD